MWTEITRAQYARAGRCYASDLDDAEWSLIEPDMPRRKPLGRRRRVALREVVNAILHVCRTGCPWRMLPKDFPPWQTVYGYFAAWRDSGLWVSIDHRLVMEAREAEGRAASPSAGVIDSQSAQTTESGGPRGFDAGKKVKGRKRHIVTDTCGFLVSAVVHPANIQDRDGAPELLASIRYRFPWLRHIFADGAYAGPKLAAALEGKGRWRLEIVKRAPLERGFKVLPRRWVVERTLAWLSRNRRLARDFEATIATARTWLFPGSVQILPRKTHTPEKTMTYSKTDSQCLSRNGSALAKPSPSGRQHLAGAGVEISQSPILLSSFPRKRESRTFLPYSVCQVFGMNLLDSRFRGNDERGAHGPVSGWPGANSLAPMASRQRARHPH